MPTMTRKELAELGWRIDRDGNPVRLSPTEPRKPHEKVDGFDSKLERDYAQHLSYLMAAGEVVSFNHHAIIIQYTPGNRYTPDFKVNYADGRVEIVEVKGHCREDDSIKCHAAAAIIKPWRVVMVQRRKGRWVRREF